MSVTLDVPDQLAERLRDLARQRGLSLNELGEQILAAGLSALAGEPGELVDLLPPQAELRPASRNVPMRSPISTRGAIRPLTISLEPGPEPDRDAH